MEYTLIANLQPVLGGMKGYVLNKPEKGAYPCFIVEADTSRGESIYNNAGKPFGYTYNIQINILSSNWREIRAYRQLVIDYLDGLTGSLSDFEVIDCRLSGASTGMSLNKNYECVLMFTLSTK